MLGMLLRNESRADVITSSDPGLAEWFGLAPVTDSGIAVTAKSAMRLAAVYACVHRLSSNMAQLPLHVMRRDGSNVVDGNDHPAHTLLSTSPNQWQSSYDWREQAQQVVLTNGNAITRLRRDRRGQLIELDLFEPEHIGEPIRGASGWYYPAYDAQEQRWFALPIYDAAHIKGFGGSRYWGMSPIRYHSETIGLGLATKKYGSQFFGGGGRPSGILIDKTSGGAGVGEPGKQHRANIKAAWKEGGIGKGSGRTALLSGDLDYKAITISPEEAQFLATASCPGLCAGSRSSTASCSRIWSGGLATTSSSTWPVCCAVLPKNGLSSITTPSPMAGCPATRSVCSKTRTRRMDWTGWTGRDAGLGQRDQADRR